MNDADRTVHRLVAAIAPDPGPGLTPLARELFEEITAEPIPARARWSLATLWPRRWFAVPVVAVLAVGTVVLGWVFPAVLGVGPTPASALDIRPAGNFYIVTVRDIFADPDVYRSELASRGLDITLILLPAAPEDVDAVIVANDDPRRKGKFSFSDGGIGTVEKPGFCGRWAGCPIGLKIPVGYPYKTRILLGREARRGERIQMVQSDVRPLEVAGEPFYCLDYYNKPVSEIRNMLLVQGVTIEPEFVYTFKEKAMDIRPSAPDDWYVHNGAITRGGRPYLFVGATPYAIPPGRRIIDGCPAG
ncbi:hypothetical protein Aple_031180 [Acrocarpospora pleiomorpha]|uniref:Uncharacterized protein n=1 Tax=Acrocarpospora pleiomorpha TaxID=90975 RepID=A0A5M3XHJ6_9ACTN|nr:hypothetical protein [Acrocarpospora pleiomorpha]GES20222.1 hypothetical protein Aple_031180 [Acrocarpospora pleiomorpha]